MNIAELKRVDVSYEGGELPPHTIYFRPDEGNVVILQPPDEASNEEANQAAEVFERAIDHAIEKGWCILTVPSEYEVKILNLGKRNNP